jgi:hypothetical protein
VFEPNFPSSEPPRVIAELGQELYVAVARAEDERRRAVTAGSRPTRSRRGGLALTIAALGAVAIVLVFLVGVSKHGPAVGVQDALADVAHRLVVSPHPSPRQFLYSKSRGTSTGVIDGGIDRMGRRYKSFICITSNEAEWAISVARDGAGRMRGGSPRYPSTFDKNNGQQYFSSFAEHQMLLKTAAGRKRLHAINHRIMTYNKAHGVTGIVGIAEPHWIHAKMQSDGQLRFGGELLTPKQLASYPRDPRSMYDRMRAFSEKESTADRKIFAKRPAKQRWAMPDGNENLWTYLTEENTAPIPADLLAARVKALAYFPGVTAAGEGTDALGRVGPKFSWTHEGTRSEILFDKDTAALLMTRATVVDPSQLSPDAFKRLPVGSVTGSYQLIEQKTLDRLPTFP